MFRTLIFLPYIVGLATESYMAVVELQPDSGTANFALSKLGIVSDATAWLVHTGLALTAICILVIWFASGLTMMLLMAGMQGIPRDIYQSAKVDGASWWRLERHITLPLLRRSIVLSLIISVIGSFLAFNQFFILTHGGPGTSTVPVVMAIYDTGFAQFDVGSASAMSVVLVIVVGHHQLRPVPFPPAGCDRLMATGSAARTDSAPRTGSAPRSSPRPRGGPHHGAAP